MPWGVPLNHCATEIELIEVRGEEAGVGRESGILLILGTLVGWITSEND